MFNILVKDIIKIFIEGMGIEFRLLLNLLKSGFSIKWMK
jgi:hypothetical protein